MSQMRGLKPALRWRMELVGTSRFRAKKGNMEIRKENGFCCYTYVLCRIWLNAVRIVIVVLSKLKKCA